MKSFRSLKNPENHSFVEVRRDLGEDLIHKNDNVLKNAVEFSFTNPPSGYKFIRQNAREMEDDMMYQYINFNVNYFTLELDD
jgi:predicted solute-binding protein